MKINRKNNYWIISGTHYDVTIIPERLIVLLRRCGTEFYYGMSMLSAVDCSETRDETLSAPFFAPPTIKDGVASLKIESESSIWDKKIVNYEFHDDRIGVSIEVLGSGNVSRCHFFRGAIEGNELGSVPGFTQFFSPLPNFIEKNHFHANEYTKIAAGNDDLLRETIRGCGLHGAPLCFVAHQNNQAPFMSIGVLAKPGEYSFWSFDLNYIGEELDSIPEPIVGSQSPSLNYEGHLRVNGNWESPVISIEFGDSCLDAVERYVRRLEQFGGTVPVERCGALPEWADRPVFCTWHEQVALGTKDLKTTAITFKQAESSDFYFRHVTQKNCEHWLSVLEAHDFLPGIFIIDAKWQKKAGSCEVDTDKFPDMRGFIDLCHKRGIRVMLWHNSWDPEGLSAEECCLINGNPVAADPTNPVYQRRVCQYMERLFSDAPGCLNADGLKVDGMTNTPHGRTLENYSGIYGFEFARVFLTLLHREMKRVKPDALLGQFTGFPYFGDLCDIARTGDLYTIKGDPNTANAFRVAIQKIAMPGVPIETDGALRFNYLLDNEEILLTQKSLGIPCLYQCENLIQRRDFCSTQITDFDDSLWGHV